MRCGSGGRVAWSARRRRVARRAGLSRACALLVYVTGMWDVNSRQLREAGAHSHHTVHTSCLPFTARVHTSATLFTLVFTLTNNTLATANSPGVALGRPRLAHKCVLGAPKLSRARPRGHITCPSDCSDLGTLTHKGSTRLSHSHLHLVRIVGSALS